MKFTYQYRTPDNKSHKGVIRAASKDAAYATLKAQGIKPGRVEEAPGFFNKLFGKGKRWIAIVVLALGCVASLLALRTQRSVIAAGDSPMMRRQIYGDPALMESLERENFASVFEDEGDRYLARFAQPAAIVRFPDSSWRREMAVALRKPDRPSIVIADTDAREVKELKRIVLWLRGELANYLSDGRGTPETYIRRLEERQQREITIYADIKVELERSTEPDLWEKRNATLRDLGIRTIPMPEGAQNFFRRGQK